jgi:hypothetical protein
MIICNINNKHSGSSIIQEIQYLASTMSAVRSRNNNWKTYFFQDWQRSNACYCQGQQFFQSTKKVSYLAPRSHLSFDYLSVGRFIARAHNMQRSERVINCGLRVRVSRAVNIMSQAGVETLLLLSLCLRAQAAHQSCGEAERAQIWPYTWNGRETSL